MADLMNLEPFDDVNSGTDLQLMGYELFGSGGESITASGRNGKGLQCATNQSECRYVNNGTLTASARTAFGFWHDQATSGREICRIQGPGYIVHLQIHTTSGGGIEVRRGASTVIATSSSTGLIGNSTWCHVEIHFTIDNTNGAVKVYLNGGLTPVINFTGDTQNAGTAEWKYIGLYRVSGTARFDDWVILNNTGTQYGDARLGVVFPNSDQTKNFTPSAGTDNWAMVDEVTQDGDTTYVESNTAGHVDTYGFQTVSTFTGVGGGIQVRAIVKKTDAGTREIQLRNVSGSTTTDGSTITLTASYVGYKLTLETNPDTGSPWTAAAINASRNGLEIVT